LAQKTGLIGLLLDNCYWSRQDIAAKEAAKEQQWKTNIAKGQHVLPHREHPRPEDAQWVLLTPAHQDLKAICVAQN
jgi:hypothetical protein